MTTELNVEGVGSEEEEVGSGSIGDGEGSTHSTLCIYSLDSDDIIVPKNLAELTLAVDREKPHPISLQLASSRLTRCILQILQHV
jgi:hypothetical protein